MPKVNLYSLTNLNGWTNGRKNSALSHEQRTPQYYEYAMSDRAAKREMQGRIPSGRFDCQLIQKGVNRPLFQSEEK